MEQNVCTEKWRETNDGMSLVNKIKIIQLKLFLQVHYFYSYFELKIKFYLALSHKLNIWIHTLRSFVIFHK